MVVGYAEKGFGVKRICFTVSATQNGTAFYFFRDITNATGRELCGDCSETETIAGVFQVRVRDVDLRGRRASGRNARWPEWTNLTAR
jgi:hypothetical protein